jgi:hypothetical protein
MGGAFLRIEDRILTTELSLSKSVKQHRERVKSVQNQPSFPDFGNGFPVVKIPRILSCGEDNAM